MRALATRGLLFCLLTAAGAPGQCDPAWRSGFGNASVGGPIYDALLWDPDRSGPAGPVLVTGSWKSFGGPASGLNYWDGSQWHPLGSLPGNSTVYALAVAPNGDLFVAGRFSSIDLMPAANVARFDGTSWHPLGSGTDSEVRDLAIDGNGDLIAAGRFQSAGGVAAERVARWDGTQWHTMGLGMDAPVHCLHIDAADRVLAGGEFSHAGGQPAGRIARFDGGAWQPLAASATGAVVEVILERTNGELAVGGRFTAIDGVPVNNLARLTGTTWNAIGGGVDGEVQWLRDTPAGLVVGGAFAPPAPGTTSGYCRWDGNAWHGIAEVWTSQYGVMNEVDMPDGDRFVAGFFGTLGGHGSRHAAFWDGTRWRGSGQGLEGGSATAVHAFVTAPGGEIIAGGNFRNAGGNIVSGSNGGVGGIAKWDGERWSDYAEGIPHHAQSVFALCSRQNGDLVAAGDFLSIGGVATPSSAASWDGTAWQPMNHQVFSLGPIHALHERPSGELLAGSRFGITRWDGSNWQLFGGTPAGRYNAITTLSTGQLVAGGSLNGGIARWTGSSWTGFGNGVDDTVHAIIELPNGDLVVGGDFQNAGGAPANYIARWDGTAWHPLGVGTNFSVLALAVLPSGDLLVGGRFTTAGGAPARGIARWDGAAWHPVGLPDDAIAFVAALHPTPDGRVFIGGNFWTAGGAAALNVTVLDPTCPATATTIPTTCAGPLGPLTLDAATLPWSGTVLRTRATGFVSNSVAVSLLGLTSPNVPLTWLWPTAGTGCDQLASQEAILLHLPQAGAVTYELALPAGPTFAGLPLFHQFLQFEVGAQNQIAGLSSSNGIELVLGTF